MNNKRFLMSRIGLVAILVCLGSGICQSGNAYSQQSIRQGSDLDGGETKNVIDISSERIRVRIFNESSQFRVLGIDRKFNAKQAVAFLKDYYESFDQNELIPDMIVQSHTKRVLDAEQIVVQELISLSKKHGFKFVYLPVESEAVDDIRLSLMFDHIRFDH